MIMFVTSTLRKWEGDMHLHLRSSVWRVMLMPKVDMHMDVSDSLPA